MEVEGWKRRSSERFGAVETFGMLQGRTINNAGPAALGT